MSEDVRRMPCPETCRYRSREHVHLEAPDGCGQVWGIGDDGRPVILDPFDLERTARLVYPVGRYTPTAIPGSCYEASWGMVHVRPGCRCPH